MLMVPKVSTLINRPLSEAVARRCSVKKVFLEISQNLHKNTCAGVSILIKLQAEATFLTEHLRWLLLHFADSDFNEK